MDICIWRIYCKIHICHILHGLGYACLYVLLGNEGNEKGFSNSGNVGMVFCQHEYHVPPFDHSIFFTCQASRRNVMEL